MHQKPSDNPLSGMNLIYISIYLHCVYKSNDNILNDV